MNVAGCGLVFCVLLENVLFSVESRARLRPSGLNHGRDGKHGGHGNPAGWRFPCPPNDTAGGLRSEAKPP